MIDQNRVRQMSRLAMMEPEIKKDVMGICSRRKADYVVLQILKGFFAGTVCYAALLLLWSVRQRLALTRVPKAFRGLPITLLSLGIISLALFGLLGNQLPA